MNRTSATKLLGQRLTDEVVVSNLGQATLDLQTHADRPLNFYTFGSMGQCSGSEVSPDSSQQTQGNIRALRLP